jgi:hypothetical protein
LNSLTSFSQAFQSILSAAKVPEDDNTATKAKADQD